MSATPAAPPSPPATLPAGRPFGTVVLAVLSLLRAALLLLAFVAPTLPPDLGPLGRILSLPAEIAMAVRDDPVAGAVVAGLIAALTMAGILLWAGRRTGWRIAILVTGFFLLIDLYLASRGQLHTLWMTLDVVAVFYLNQRDVREYYGIGREQDG
jgi:hypothetical protein